MCGVIGQAREASDDQQAPAHGPTSTEPEQDEKRGRPGQHPAAVIPLLALVFGKSIAIGRRDPAFDRGDIGIIGRDGDSSCTRDAGKVIKSSSRRTHREEQNRRAFSGGMAFEGGRVFTIKIIQGKENSALDIFIGQDRFGQCECGRRISAFLRHDVGRQTFQKRLQQIRVFGQRHDLVSRAGIGDQSRAGAGAASDEIENFLLGALEPAWRYVGLKHRLRDVEDDGQRCCLGNQGIGDPAPGRPCDRQ